MAKKIKENTKTKQIVISAQSQELYTIKRLLAESLKLNYSCEFINPYQFSFSLQNTPQLNFSSLEKESSIYLHRTTGVNYDDFDLVVSKHFDMMNFKVTNPIESLALFRTKDQQALFFKLHNIPFIPTLFFRGDIHSTLIADIDKLAGKSHAYVLKMSRGNGGIGVNIINGQRSLLSLLETFRGLKDQKMLIQPFIPHKKEWRILIIKGEIHACIEKTINPDDFRGNSKKSVGKFIAKPNQILRELALRAFNASRLDYAGIDILLNSHTEEFIVCEINAIPGFEQVEKLSKLNIAKEILTHI